MAVSPTGILNAPLTTLRTYFANSATFQTLTGAANATAAEAFIFLYGVGRDDVPTGGNYIVVDHAGGFGYGRTQLDNSWQTRRGGLWADITIAIPSENQADPQDAHVYGVNKIGAILSELQTYAATHQSLVLYSWELSAGPMRSEKEERDDADYISALVTLEVS